MKAVPWERMKKMTKIRTAHILLLAIFASALFFAASALSNPVLGEDVMLSAGHYISNAASLEVGEPPVAHSLLAFGLRVAEPFGVGPFAVWAFVSSACFALASVTVYTLSRRATGSEVIAVSSAFLTVFSSLLFILAGFGYCKQLLGITLTPIVILGFWHGLNEKRQRVLVLSGVLAGVVGLTHEIAFASIIIALLGYVGFVSANEKRIREDLLKATALVAIPALVLAGPFYASKTTTIMDACGEGTQEYTLFYGTHFNTPVSNYSEPVLFSLATIGVVVLLSRRSPFDLFLVSWLLSAVIIAQPWAGFSDRFEIQMVLPLALISGMVIGQLSYLLRMARRFAGTIVSNFFTIQVIGYVGAFLILFLVFQSVTITNFSGGSSRPEPVIDNSFNFLLWPISLAGLCLDGLTSALVKVVVGIPATIAFWVLTVKFALRKIGRIVFEEGAEFRGLGGIHAEE